MDVDQVVVGRIICPHGVQGKIIVEPLTENPERFGAGSRLLLEGDGEDREVIVEAAAPYKRGLLVSIEGISDRTAAEGLRGRYLSVLLEELPEPEEGEFYHHQLVGLEVIDQHGETLGAVTNVLSLPAQDMLVIERDGKEHMIPFVEEFIREVSLDAGTILVDNMPGLIHEKS